MRKTGPFPIRPKKYYRLIEEETFAPKHLSVAATNSSVGKRVDPLLLQQRSAPVGGGPLEAALAVAPTFLFARRCVTILKMLKQNNNNSPPPSALHHPASAGLCAPGAGSVGVARAGSPAGTLRQGPPCPPSLPTPSSQAAK